MSRGGSPSAFQFFSREQVTVGGQQFLEREVAGTVNMPGNRVNRLLYAVIPTGVPRIDEVTGGCCTTHVFARDDGPRPDRPGGFYGGFRGGGRLSRLQFATRPGPCRQSAVQDLGIHGSLCAQHPPEPGSDGTTGVIVCHVAGMWCGAMP